MAISAEEGRPLRCFDSFGCGPLRAAGEVKSELAQTCTRDWCSLKSGNDMTTLVEQLVSLMSI